MGYNITMNFLTLSLAIVFSQTPAPLRIVDADKKEISLPEWKLTFGSRQLPWLKGDASTYLEFREDKSTQFLDGILTLIPTNAVKSIAFNPEKKILEATVAQPGDRELILTGPTQFLAINRYTFEADRDLGNLGLATVKYQLGGIPHGLLSVQFTKAAAVEKMPGGQPATIVAMDKEKSKHALVDPAPLYLVGKEQKLMPSLFTKTGAAIDWKQVRKMTMLPPMDKKSPPNQLEITLVDGMTTKLNFNDTPKVEGQIVKFLGLAGRVPAGYRIFPPYAIAEIQVLPNESEKK